MESPSEFQKALLAWYRRERRDLPWRNTTDPYRILLSEVMLQQTRVAAVIPYYERFLERFPDPAALAAAPEPDLLAAWAGLGYYARARNLQRAARRIVELGGFPQTYEGIRRLPGVGDYTAAAVASIAFGLAHAVVDGNVLRVLSRLYNDSSEVGAAATKRAFLARAGNLLPTRHAGSFNQAMMELGATLCLPKSPRCLLCPVRRFCTAYRHGRPEELPVKARRFDTRKVERTVLIVVREGKILLLKRGDSEKRLAGFLELPDPEQLPEAAVERPVGVVRHSIVHQLFHIHVTPARIRVTPENSGFVWIALNEVGSYPISTATRKALECWTKWAALLPGD